MIETFDIVGLPAKEGTKGRFVRIEDYEELRRDLMECAGHAADIMEGKDTPTGMELDAVMIQIKLSAVCRIAETYLEDESKGGNDNE